MGIFLFIYTSELYKSLSEVLIGFLQSPYACVKYFSGVSGHLNSLPNKTTVDSLFKNLDGTE